MAIGIQKIEQALDDRGIRYHREDDTTILTGVKGEHAKIGLVLRLLEAGEYLDVRTLNFATVESDHPRFDDAIELLSEWNSDRKILKIGWDPDDGEVVCLLSIPLEDNEDLPVIQFHTGLFALIATCDELYAELEPIISDTKGPRKKKPPRRHKDDDAASPGESGGAETKKGDGPMQSSLQLIGCGVVLLGLAALLGVIYLFVR